MDQGLSSVTNFLAGVLIARSGGPAVLGGFSIGVTLYLILLGVQRTLITGPMTIVAAPAEEDERTRHLAAGATSVLVLGMVAGFLTYSFSAVLPSEFQQAVRSISYWVAPLLFHDFLRNALFTKGRPRAAAASDLAWLLAMGPAYLLLRGTELTPLVAIWGTGALAACASGMALLRLHLVGVRKALHWWRNNARVPGGWFFLDHVMYSLTSQGSVLIISVAGGASILGGLKAVQTLFAPISFLLIGASFIGLPEMSRKIDNSAQDAWLLARVIALFAGLATVGWSVVLIVTGPKLLRGVFGSEFAEFSVALVPIAIVQTIGALSFGFDLLITAARRGKSRLRTRFFLLLGFPILALLTGKLAAEGAAWGMALLSCITLTGLLLICRNIRRQDSPLQQ